MLKQIGGYMPRMWEGRCKPCSLRSAVCSVPPMSRGCRAHIATPGTVGRNTGLDVPVPGRTITDRAPVTDRCATDEAMNACAAARDEGLFGKRFPAAVTEVGASGSTCSREGTTRQGVP